MTVATRVLIQPYNLMRLHTIAASTSMVSVAGRIVCTLLAIIASIINRILLSRLSTNILEEQGEQRKVKRTLVAKKVAKDGAECDVASCQYSIGCWQRHNLSLSYDGIPITDLLAHHLLSLADRHSRIKSYTTLREVRQC